MHPLPIQIQRNGHSFRVAHSHPEFWAAFNSGAWEEETLRLFDHCLSRETVHLDVGAWIGPTLLYAAGRAGLAFAFEPDPQAYRTLAENVALNPLLGTMRTFPFAIASRHGQSRMGSKAGQLGDSMSSLLFADSPSNWTAELRKIEEFEGEWPPGARLFLKIDIEGGEYELLPHLRNFILRRRPTICLSLHPHFFMLPYMGSGRLRQLIGETRLLINFRRFMTVFRHYTHLYDPAGGRISRRRLWQRRTWRHLGGLVLSNTPIPFLD